jgi:hypothetical protein
MIATRVYGDIDIRAAPPSHFTIYLCGGGANGRHLHYGAKGTVNDTSFDSNYSLPTEGAKALDTAPPVAMKIL